MIPIHPQYVVDESVNRTAMLIPTADWERILDELDELDDIRAYDGAKRGPQESVPLEQAVREIEDGYLP